MRIVVDIDGTLTHIKYPNEKYSELAPYPHIREWLQRYKDEGIRHLVALRGDLPSGLAAAGEFRYANELVEFILSFRRIGRKEFETDITLKFFLRFHSIIPGARHAEPGNGFTHHPSLVTHFGFSTGSDPP